ncbi:hypothetical protein LC040_00970 [Bacillus tianshenii]|nr:hypothetical protein LC040_00970 [Bacillus tianshenii]
MKKNVLIPAGSFIVVGILLLIFPIHSLTFQLLVLGISFFIFYFLRQGPLKEENFVWLLLGSLLGALGVWNFLKQFAWFSNPGLLYIGLGLAFVLIFFLHTLHIRSANPHLLYWPLYCSLALTLIAFSIFFKIALWAIILVLLGAVMLFLQS